MRPTGRFLLLCACGLPLAAVPTIAGSPGLAVLWLSWIGLCVLWLLLELLLSPRAADVAIEIEAPAVLHLGDPAVVRLTVTAKRNVDLELQIERSGPCAELPPGRCRVTDGATQVVELPLVAERRGEVRLLAMHRRSRGPLGLLWWERQQPLDQRIIVLANLPAVRRRAGRLLEQRQLRSGMRIERHLGDGSDFDSLREFVVGMDHRSIDWKATARHREVLSRQFRVERDHAVMVCIDTGRLMGEPLRGLPRLDHAIHAALQLANVTVRAGDRIGLFAFADAPQQLLPPQAGLPALRALQERLTTLDYSPAETNFTRALTELLQRLRRRTLVVLFTEFVDDVTAELMLRNLRWLQQRHLLLFVAMRDPLLAALVDRQPATIDDLHRAVVAADLQRERAVVLERIRAAGAKVLDADVDELEQGLVQRYLEIKRRELV